MLRGVFFATENAPFFSANKNFIPIPIKKRQPVSQQSAFTIKNAYGKIKMSLVFLRRYNHFPNLIHKDFGICIRHRLTNLMPISVYAQNLLAPGNQHKRNLIFGIPKFSQHFRLHIKTISITDKLANKPKRRRRLHLLP